jgi:hypothetical protein
MSNLNARRGVEEKFFLAMLRHYKWGSPDSQNKTPIIG